MWDRITFQEWESKVNTDPELTRNWGKLTLKKDNQEKIFDILTKHKYSFESEFIPSNNPYSINGMKKIYTDSSFRWALLRINQIRGKKYLKNETIEGIIKIIKQIQAIEEAKNNHYSPQSKPQNIQTLGISDPEQRVKELEDLYKPDPDEPRRNK